MNIDPDLNKFPTTPPAAATKDKRWIWPFVYLLIFLAVAVIWSFICGSCISGNGGGSGSSGSGSGNGPGTAGVGSGGGSGQGTSTSGDGPGAEASGTGTGKLPQPPPKPSAGSGEKSGTAGPKGTEKASTNTPIGEQGTASSKDLQPVAQVEYLADTPKPLATAKSGNGGNVTGRKGFYGVDTSGSSRAIFIVDTSGSMSSSSQEIPGKSRIDVLKMELKKSISPHRENKIGGFIILSFNSETTRFPDNEKLCRYRNKKAMQEAHVFIDNLQASGGTMMCQVWLQAIQIADKQKIDTIYFMTDGMPGDQFNDQWLLPELSKNRLHKVKVHCITVGHQQPFMQQIAQQTRGQYIYIP